MNNYDYKYLVFILDDLEDAAFYSEMEARRHKMDSEAAKAWHEFSNELDAMLQRARKLAALPPDVSGVEEQ